MAVFTDDLQNLNINNVKESLGQIENYIRYMSERVEFSNRNLVRELSELRKEVRALDDRVKALEQK